MQLTKLYWDGLKYGFVEFGVGFYKFSAWIPRRPAPLRVVLWLTSPWENEEDSMRRGGWQLIKPAKDWKKNPNTPKKGTFPVVIFEGKTVRRTTGKYRGRARIVYQAVGVAYKPASAFGYKARREKNNEITLHEVSIIGRGDKIRCYQWIKDISAREEARVKKEFQSSPVESFALSLVSIVKRSGRTWTNGELKEKSGLALGRHKWEKVFKALADSCGEKPGLKKVARGREWVYWYDGERGGMGSKRFNPNGTIDSYQTVTFEDGHVETIWFDRNDPTSGIVEGVDG
jgi:hypothetical protein